MEASEGDRVRVYVTNKVPEGTSVHWHRILAKKGWVAPFWPKEWGGTGWTVVQRYIFEEECGAAGCPPIVCDNPAPAPGDRPAPRTCPRSSPSRGAPGRGFACRRASLR